MSAETLVRLADYMPPVWSVDAVELRVAESYVSKGDFNHALMKMEGHMQRIEEKLDKLVEKKCN